LLDIERRMTTQVLLVAALLLAPGALPAQGAASDSCTGVYLRAPTLWVGYSIAAVNLRTGPGTQFPMHESGQLIPGERIFVLQACHGWLQARVIPPAVIDRAVQMNGRERAQQMLLFWVRADLIRRRP
jgi:hypothetical protein